MTQVGGEILRNGAFAGYVIARSDALDADIERAGMDPDDVNVATTALVGASRHGTMTVLAYMSNQATPNAFPLKQELLSNSFNDLFTLYLFEPQASQGGGVQPGEKPGPTGPPNISEGAVPIVPTPVDDATDVVTSRTEALTSGSTQTFSNRPVTKLQLGRQMTWQNLTLVHAQELLASAAGSAQRVSDPAFPAYGGSLFILRFADARFRLNGQTVFSMETPGAAGVARDQWNMLAENPLHLVAATAKTSTYQPPSPSGPAYRGTGTITNTLMLGIPSPSGWHGDTCWSAAEIISAYVSQVGFGMLDRSAISYIYSQTADQYEKPGDMLNLDLRGKSVGEALDEIAARIGCVWFWDRFASQLTLRPVTSGLPGYATTGYADVTTWWYWNGPFRCGGGLNEITNELPGRWATVHPIRYVSVYGRQDETAVYVDWRSMSTPDGVRHLSLESSDRPPLYYAIGSGNGRTHFVGDHLPAYYGRDGSMMDYDIGTAPSASQFSVWNRTRTAARNLWWQKPWAQAIDQRLSTIMNRYKDAGKIIDGEVVLNRMPAYGFTAPSMRETFSAGLQWDEIRFGMGSEPVQYRLWGSNTDTLLFPHLLTPDRVRALGLGSAYFANGCMNLQRLEKRSGIVRTFLAEIKQQTVLKRDATSNDPFVWLYAFKEVAPDNLANGTFRKANEWGFENLAMEGRALNLCEMATIGTTVADVPAQDFDGGTLRYNPTGTAVKITRASLRGIAPCYEYITPTGMTVFFIYAPNGVQVTCSGSTTPLLTSAWQNSGASGTGFADRVPLSGIVSDMPVATREVPVASEPEPAP
jgi:hypothetical protein